MTEMNQRKTLLNWRDWRTYACLAVAGLGASAAWAGIQAIVHAL